jgi:septin 7
MAESFTSRTTDVSGNGYANGSSPSLVQTGQPAAQSPASNIIRKKLMGYVGFANLPNQVHRKSVRKGFQFTTMVVGTFLLAAVISSASSSDDAYRRVWLG